MTLQEQVDHLLQCLATELALSDQLLELGRLQQRALTNHHDEQLQPTSDAMDAKLRQVASARRRSETAVAAIAAEVGIEAESVSLEDLALAIGDPHALPIRQMASRLVDTATALYRQNDLNRQLLINAVQYVSFCMRLFSGVDERPCYGGGAQARGNSVLLDQTA